jgi:hypothetical protein
LKISGRSLAIAYTTRCRDHHHTECLRHPPRDATSAHANDRLPQGHIHYFDEVCLRRLLGYLGFRCIAADYTHY